jgi:beta-1,4-mannosyltransferase
MTDRSAAPVRVLQLLADPDRQGDRPVDNPYTSLLIGSLPTDRVRTSYFRWGRILTERFDVLHVHWPENSLRHPRRLARAVKTAVFALFLARIRLQRKAVVRTVHNVQPHESGTRAERRLLAWLDDLTTLWIILNETTPTPDPARTVLVPHGHYRDWYTPSPSARPVPGRLLTFGMIRRYKGTEELVTAFRAVSPDAALSLHVVGAPGDAATAAHLVARADGDPRIHLDLRFVAEQELADELGEAELVILPYRAMHNSGAALLALSLDRPVIVPSSDATELLVEEFGSEWVTTYSGELDTAALVALVDRARDAHRGAAPVDLSQREWPALAALLVDAYERAVGLARGRR